MITPKPVNTVVKTAPRHIDYNDSSFIRVWQTIAGVGSDGIRGPKTTSAVKSIQRRIGVNADGVPERYDPSLSAVGAEHLSGEDWVAQGRGFFGAVDCAIQG